MALTAASILERLKAAYGAAPSSEGAAIQEKELKKLADALFLILTADASVTVSVPGTGLVSPQGPVTGAASGTGKIA